MNEHTPAASGAPAPTATQDAAATNDFAAFDRARVDRVTSAATAAADGKPVEKPAPGKPDWSKRAAKAAPVKAADATTDDTAVAASGAPAETNDDTLEDGERRPNRRERNEEYISKRIREGIEAGLTPIKAELAALKGGTKPEEAASGAKPLKDDKAATWQRYKALPDAPKQDEFDDYSDYVAAMGVFIADTRDSERAAKQTQERDAAAHFQAKSERYGAFSERVTKEKEADPAFVAGLSKDFLELYGMDSYREKRAAAEAAGQTFPGPGPRQILAECLYDTEHYGPMARELSKPDVFAKILTMPERVAKITDPQQRMYAHIDYIRQEFARLEGRVSGTAPPASPSTARATTRATTEGRRDAADKSVSKAPPPAPTFRKATSSGDSETAAVKRGDFTSFDQQRMDRLIERRRGGHAGA